MLCLLSSVPFCKSTSCSIRSTCGYTVTLLYKNTHHLQESNGDPVWGKTKGHHRKMYLETRGAVGSHPPSNCWYPGTCRNPSWVRQVHCWIVLPDLITTGQIHRKARKQGHKPLTDGASIFCACFSPHWLILMLPLPSFPNCSLKMEPSRLTVW